MLSSLKSGWTNTTHESLVTAMKWKLLPPFSELGHPAIQACQGFESNHQSGRFTRHESATRAAGYPVFEARDTRKGPGWRTAIIRFDDAYWAVFADTHKTFHSTVAARFKHDRTDLEPTPDDIDWRRYKEGEAVTKEEVREWRRDVVRATLLVFRRAWSNADHSASVTLPEPPVSVMPEGVARIGAKIDVELLMAEDDERGASGGVKPADAGAVVEVVLAITPPVHVTDPISDQLIQTVLPTIAPDEDRWTGSAIYSKGGELLHSTLLSANELEQLLFAAEFEGETAGHIPKARPTSHAHYVSASTIVESVVSGRPMRSACGIWLVSRRNPDGMDVCEKCVEQLPDVSVVKELLKHRILGT